MWVYDRLPEDGVVVIVEFAGYWNHRGNGGIVDIYTWEGEWFNIPDSVTIIRWMYIP